MRYSKKLTQHTLALIEELSPKHICLASDSFEALFQLGEAQCQLQILSQEALSAINTTREGMLNTELILLAEQISDMRKQDAIELIGSL